MTHFLRRASVRTPTTLIIVLVLLLVGSGARAEAIAGKVVKVADGDTITILVDREQVRVRLANIDTPERKQPRGRKAKQALADIVAGGWAEFDPPQSLSKPARRAGPPGMAGR